MSRHKITATVSVDVEMSIEAADIAEARAIFSDQLIMSASLADIPKAEYAVYEDSISGIEAVSAEPECVTR